MILLAALASALIFAAIENFYCLNVLIDSHSSALRFWRWTICTAMHASATSLAALGVMRMHRSVFANIAPPDLRRAAPWLLAAMILHGSYNAFAILIDNAFFRNAG